VKSAYHLARFTVSLRRDGAGVHDKGVAICVGVYCRYAECRKCLCDSLALVLIHLTAESQHPDLFILDHNSRLPKKYVYILPFTAQKVNTYRRKKQKNVKKTLIGKNIFKISLKMACD
jgi:hypothetical protein